jgi:hypothetical protein
MKETTTEGKKELLGFEVGVEESTESARSLLKSPLTTAHLASGGRSRDLSWHALHDVSQVHKTINISDKIALRSAAENEARPARDRPGAILGHQPHHL